MKACGSPWPILQLWSFLFVSKNGQRAHESLMQDWQRERTDTKTNNNFVERWARNFPFLFKNSPPGILLTVTTPFTFFQAINQSDVIMSFANRGHQEELQWTQLFWFDTNELPDSDDEEILSAELRMYKKAMATGSTPTYFNLKVYQLVEGSTGPSQLLDSQKISYDEEGNISTPLNSQLSSYFICHLNL